MERKGKKFEGRAIDGTSNRVSSRTTSRDTFREQDMYFNLNSISMFEAFALFIYWQYIMDFQEILKNKAFQVVIDKIN